MRDSQSRIGKIPDTFASIARLSVHVSAHFHSAMWATPGRVDNRVADDDLRRMKKLASLVGATVGGYAGWWVGAHVGIMTAFIAGMVGTGAGMYWGVRLARRYYG